MHWRVGVVIHIRFKWLRKRSRPKKPAIARLIGLDYLEQTINVVVFSRLLRNQKRRNCVVFLFDLLKIAHQLSLIGFAIDYPILEEGIVRHL
jgi:hypothetical protein